MLKLAFDVGGVLSKYPDKFRPIISVLGIQNLLEVHVISDMHPKEKIVKMLRDNAMFIDYDKVHSADYAKYGEACKSILCKELGIDILIDDFIGYVAGPDPLLRLLVMPNPAEPYYHDDWLTDGSEGDFGRRRK